jgi:hypothetical protein
MFLGIVGELPRPSATFPANIVDHSGAFAILDNIQEDLVTRRLQMILSCVFVELFR